MRTTVLTLVHVLLCGVVNLFAMEERKPFEILVSRFEAGNCLIEVVMDVYPTGEKITLVPTVRFTNDEWIRTCVRFGSLLAALDEAHGLAPTNTSSTHGDLRIRRIDRGYEMKFSDGKFGVMVLTGDMVKKLAHDIRFMLEITKLNCGDPSSRTDAGQSDDSTSPPTGTKEPSNSNQSPQRQPQEGNMPGSKTDGGEPANAKGSSTGKEELPNKNSSAPPPASEGYLCKAGLSS